MSPVQQIIGEPQIIAQSCPCCGGDVAAFLVYIRGRGYLVVLKCEAARCNYRRVK